MANGIQEPVSVSALAELVKGEVYGDGNVLISGVAVIEHAGSGEIAFLARPSGFSKFGKFRGGALIVKEPVSEYSGPLILHHHPQLAFARIIEFFHPRHFEPRGVHPSAHVGRECLIERDVTISAGAFLGDRVVIGDRVTISPGVVLGDEVQVGEGSFLAPNVSVNPGCVIGRNVILHSGVVIGSDGFGYVREGDLQVKVPQVGNVIIEDDVEIGANSCVDRATLGSTIIKRGVKIDNLVQIAHNVIVGEHSIIVSQGGISGSSTLGHHVVMAGQAGVADHVEVGNNVIMGGRAGATKNIPSGSVVAGFPVVNHKEWLKVQASLYKLPEVRKTVRRVEQQVTELIEKIKFLQEKEG